MIPFLKYFFLKSKYSQKKIQQKTLKINFWCIRVIFNVFSKEFKIQKFILMRSTINMFISISWLIFLIELALTLLFFLNQDTKISRKTKGKMKKKRKIKGIKKENKELGGVCFPESGFWETTFQTFLCLFVIRKVSQRNTLSSQRKIWLGFQESVFLLFWAENTFRKLWKIY